MTTHYMLKENGFSMFSQHLTELAPRLSALAMLGIKVIWMYQAPTVDVLTNPDTRYRLITSRNIHPYNVAADRILRLVAGILIPGVR